jgi:hypothetical protein
MASEVTSPIFSGTWIISHSQRKKINCTVREVEDNPKLLCVLNNPRSRNLRHCVSLPSDVVFVGVSLLFFKIRIRTHRRSIIASIGKEV